MIAHEIVDAIHPVRGFLAAGEGKLQRSARAEILLPQPHHEIEKHRRHRFVVGGTTGVEIAVLFDERKRIALPVLTPGVDDIDA